MTTKRTNSARRRPASRAPRTRLLVVCGAKRTEPDYLTGLVRAARNPATVVKVVVRARDPKDVVGYARKYRESAADDFDQVWCVLDVDEFSFVDALAGARKDGTHLAISNPCFELWLLLHHAEVNVSLDGAADVVTRLKRCVPGYDKAALCFADFAPGVPDAVRRAQILASGDTELGPNPSTGVWRLVELIIREA